MFFMIYLTAANTAILCASNYNVSNPVYNDGSHNMLIFKNSLAVRNLAWKGDKNGFLFPLKNFTPFNYICIMQDVYRSQDSIVGIATGYALDDRGVGVRVPVGSRIFFSPQHPDWLRGPPSLLFNGYQGLFPRR
jgi:hypothetical protein